MATHRAPARSRRGLRAAHAIALAAILAAGCSSDEEGNDTLPPDDPAVARAALAGIGTLGRADIQPTGNRVVDGTGAFTSSDAPQEITLPGAPRWVIPVHGHEPGDSSPASGDGWVVLVGDDNRVVTVADPLSDPATATGTIATDRGVDVGPTSAPDLAVELLRGATDAVDPLADVGDAIPDARVVTRADGLRAVLTDPTERYPHGVLGDAVEAGAITVIDDAGASVATIPVAAPDVVEAIAPMFGDVDGDGTDEIVVTVSNADTGARLSAFGTDGTLVGESDPIGLGNRWRNLLAVAPVGPDGEIEVIDVRTPHIGGTLQFFRFDPERGRLDRVAAAETFSTHTIGSVNLDMGIVSDADGDGRLEVMLPSQDRRSIHVIARVAPEPGVDPAVDLGGTVEIRRIDLPAPMSTNLAARTDADGGVTYAVGTEDGRLLVWPAP